MPPRDHTSQQLSAPINRSYDVEYSDTHPIIELKLRSAGPVLRTEMTREAPVTIVLPFFCTFNYVYALNYPLRLEWARLTQKRARTARAAVGTRSEPDRRMSTFLGPETAFFARASGLGAIDAETSEIG